MSRAVYSSAEASGDLARTAAACPPFFPRALVFWLEALGILSLHLPRQMPVSGACRARGHPGGGRRRSFARIRPLARLLGEVGGPQALGSDNDRGQTGCPEKAPLSTLALANSLGQPPAT